MIANLAYHTNAAGRYVVADSGFLPSYRAAVSMRNGAFAYAYVHDAEGRLAGVSELDVLATVLFSDLARDVERRREIVIEDEDVLMDLVALYYAWLNPAPMRRVQNAYCVSYAAKLSDVAIAIRATVELERTTTTARPQSERD